MLLARTIGLLAMWMVWAWMMGVPALGAAPFKQAGDDLRLEYQSEPVPGWCVVQDEGVSTQILYTLVDAPQTFEEAMISADGKDVVLRHGDFPANQGLNSAFLIWFHQGRRMRVWMISDLLSDSSCVARDGESLSWLKDSYTDAPGSSLVVEACDGTATQVSLPNLTLIKREKIIPELTISSEKVAITDFFGRTHGLVRYKDSQGRIRYQETWEHGVKLGTVETRYDEDTGVICKIISDGQGRLHGQSLCQTAQGAFIERRIYRHGRLEGITMGEPFADETKASQGNFGLVDGSLIPTKPWRSWRKTEQGIVHESHVRLSTKKAFSCRYTLDEGSFHLEEHLSYCKAWMPDKTEIVLVFDPSEETWGLEKGVSASPTITRFLRCLDGKTNREMNLFHAKTPTKLYLRSYDAHEFPSLVPHPLLPALPYHK